MEKMLKEYLRDKETILWQGEPSNVQLFDNASKAGIIRRWIITICLSAALIGMYCTRNPNWSMGFVGAVAVIALAIVVSPFIECAQSKNQKYFLTNERAIAIVKGKEIYSMELSDIDDYLMLSDMAAQDCLVLGSEIFADAKKQLRWRSIHVKNNAQKLEEKDKAFGLVFYCINNAEAAVEVLEKRSKKFAA